MEDDNMRESIISQMNNRLIYFLIDNGNITANDKEVYMYVLRSVEITMLNVISSLCIGMCLRKTIETIILLATLIPLRSHTGGCHCKDSRVCFVGSNGIVVMILLLSFLDMNAWFNVMRWILLGISYVIILFYAPVPSPNKPLTLTERQCVGKRARIILHLALLGGLLLSQIQVTYAIIIAEVIVICAVLMMMELVRVKIIRINAH